MAKTHQLIGRRPFWSVEHYLGLIYSTKLNITYNIGLNNGIPLPLGLSLICKVAPNLFNPFSPLCSKCSRTHEM